jgi:peptide/nickel transport system ATP-binding protein
VEATLAGEPLLGVEHLHIHYGQGAGKKTIVHDISFSLRRNESLGIVGESGSGKSMTAKSLVQLLPPGVQVSGSVRLDGTELVGAPRSALRAIRGRRISLLLQDPFTMLNPVQTIAATMRESLPSSQRRGGRQGRAEIARRLLEVGLDSAVMSRYPFQLSGGQRQRVAIAAVLAKDPDILLADEPTTALDVTTQAEIIALLRRLRAERGMSLLLITHDLQVAFAVCDRIAVMYAGTVVEAAGASDLEQEPLHPYSAGLLASDVPPTGYVERLAYIPGSVPSASSWTAAGRCPFTERCAWHGDQCEQALPPLVRVAPARESACVRIGEIRRELPRLAILATAEGSLPAVMPSVPRASETELVRITDLTKVYRQSAMLGRGRETRALQGVSLSIGEGESVGLVGESGSGKTTIARIMLGLVTADEGQVTVGGVDATRFRKLRRKDLRTVRETLQMVFQDPFASLNPMLRIGDAIAEALARRDPGATEGPRSVAEVLDTVGLPASYASRRPAQLSGGECQRVSIARAVAVHPKVLVCDEPVAALDVSVQAQILELLRDVRARYGMSLLFITHDLAVVRQMTQRIVVLYRGQIVEQGSTQQVLDKPGHAYTIRLLDSVPMNLRVASEPARRSI